MCHKITLKFEDCKNCIEAAQIERKINYLRKTKIGGDSLKEDQKNNKLILKISQRFKSERHAFIEEINKIALSSNDNKNAIN